VTGAPTSCPQCGTALPPDAKFCHRCGASQPSDTRSDTERLRDALGPDYAVTGELGRGGFAVVYLVEDLKARRHLALKVLRRELLLSHVLVARFRREIELASRLSHPNILPVKFAGEAQGLAYYAMPRVKGKTLKEVLRSRGTLPVPEAVRLLRDVASALAHAHDRGVAHRDIKPSNIMLDPNGRPLILDFGLARALAATEGSTLTVSGEIIGSPQYLAPEQAAGDGNLDHRCDVYNWGLVAYEALAGKPAFDGESVQEVLYKQVVEEPTPLRELRPDAHPGIVAVVERALRKDREDRWQRMDDAVAALDAELPAAHLRQFDRAGKKQIPGS
jgi:eukaryotic-like serine/threonine-protein kinase